MRRRCVASYDGTIYIADVFYRAGLIEKWGRGTNRVVDMCRASGIRPPEFAEITGAAMVRFRVNVLGLGRETTPVTGEVTGQVEAHDKAHDEAQVAREDGTKLALSRHQVKILRNCLSDKTLLDIMAVTGRSDRTKFRHQVLNPLLNMGLLEMTPPDKPRSSKQRYRITAKGRQILKKENKE